MSRTRTNWSRAFPVVLLSLAVAVSATAGTHQVLVSNYTFSPDPVTVSPGDTVHWVWVSGFHTVTSGTNCTYDNTYFDHPIDSTNPTFDFVIPLHVNKIPYFCRNHCVLMNMKGTIIVAIPGDLNCDGVVNFADIDPFVLALSDQASYEAQFPNCRYLNGDCNGDGLVDFADIDPFVALLSG